MSVDLDNVVQDFEIEQCPHHPCLEDKFCKQCKNPICSRCVESWHRGHDIVSLEQEIQEQHAELKVFLSSGKGSVLEAQKRDTETRKILRI